MRIYSNSPDETLKLGKRLGRLLKAGDVVYLTGDLGAGKTLFVQGVAVGIGTFDDVTSPTFTILQVYQAPILIYHYDLYRIQAEAELIDIGIDEYLSSGGITLIEWPERFAEALPEHAIRFEFKHCGIDKREINCTANGKHYEELLKEFINGDFSNRN